MSSLSDKEPLKNHWVEAIKVSYPIFKRLNNIEGKFVKIQKPSPRYVASNLGHVYYMLTKLVSTFMQDLYPRDDVLSVIMKKKKVDQDLAHRLYYRALQRKMLKKVKTKGDFDNFIIDQVSDYLSDFKGLSTQKIELIAQKYYDHLLKTSASAEKSNTTLADIQKMVSKRR